MANKYQAALALSYRGFSIFPIAPGKKAPPLLTNWVQHATTDTNQVCQWWEKWPEANIGIHCAGMIVVDVDPKKNGPASLALLPPLPKTLTTQTPSGGWHLFFKAPHNVPNGVDVLGPGLDIRSKGGYVVAPGSDTDKGNYRFTADVPIAEAPAWLLDKFGQAPTAKKHSIHDIPDAPAEALVRGLAWLQLAPRSVKGGGGDQIAYGVACKLRDMGLSFRQACEAMRGVHWDYGCGWRENWLEAKPITSAYRYAQNEGGGSEVTAEDFPIVGPATPPGAAKLIIQAPWRVKALAGRTDVGEGYIIKGLLQRGSYSMIYGPPGCGKTFLALDMSYTVAAGLKWMERRVHQGVTLYLAYEGVGGMVKRSQALVKKYGESDVPMFIASSDYNLREVDGRKQVGEILNLLPDKPVLIVIDTFARAMRGGDENSAQDAGAFNDSVGALIKSTNACVLVVHHCGKQGGPARGSSAILGAVDSELEVSDYLLSVTKQRDIELADPVGFDLVPVTVGLDDDNDEITSCVVQPRATPVKTTATKLTGHTELMFATLELMSPGNQPVARETWYNECRDALPTAENTARKTFARGILQLRHMQLIVEDNSTFTRRLA